MSSLSRDIINVMWLVTANKGWKKELFLEQNLILITLECSTGGKSGAQCEIHVIHHQIKSCDTIVFKSRDVIHLCHKCHSVMIPTFDLFHHLTTVKRIRSCSTRPKLDFTSPVDLKRISMGYGTLRFFIDSTASQIMLHMDLIGALILVSTGSLGCSVTKH